MNLDTPEIQDKIEAYILGQLSPEDKRAFEADVAKHPDLQEEIALQQSMHSLFNDKVHPPTLSTAFKEVQQQVHSDKIKDHSKHLKTVAADFHNSKGKPKKNLFFWYSSGIAATLLIGILFMFNASPLERQYDTYQNWNDLPSYIEKGQEKNSLQEIELFYAQQEYDTIIALLQAERLSDISEEKLIFLGASYFKKNQPEKAIPTFDHLTQRPTLISSAGHWYKLLIYMSQEDQEQVEQMLDIIMKDAYNYKYKEAVRIKEALSR